MAVLSAFDVITGVFTVGICLTAFLYCAIKLSKKETPRYYVFLNLACGCYAVEEICAGVYAFCGNIEYQGFQSSSLGMIGCALFLLTAEIAVKKLVAPQTGSAARAAGLAWIGPGAVLLFTVISIVLAQGTGYVGATVLMGVVLLPLCPVAYYALKHLLLCKEIAICRRTRRTNALLLLFVFSNLLFFVGYFFLSKEAIDAISLLLGAEMALLSLTCVREEKAWKI